MRLDVGEVDFTSHIHVPAVGVHTHAPSDDLSDSTGHAAALSSQSASVTKKNICIGGFGKQMRRVSHGQASVLHRVTTRQQW